MRTVIRIILFLVLAGILGIVGIAVFSDLSAPQREVELPVEAK